MRYVVGISAFAVLLIGAYWFTSALISEKELLTSIQSCAGQSGNQQIKCFSEIADVLAAYSYGTRAELIDTALDHRDFLAVCHGFSHQLGAALYREEKSLADSLGLCTSACSGGCFHGAAEAYLIDHAGVRISEDRFVEEISSLEMSDQFTTIGHEADAMHGVGHALMVLTGSDVLRVLDICSIASTAEACYAGVFMSNIMSLDNVSHPSDYIRRDDPLFPCLILAERYRESCFITNADHFLTESIEQNSMTCETFPASYQNICFERIAKHDANAITDNATLASLCSSAPYKYRVQCLKGVASRILERGSDTLTNFQAFCRTQDIIHDRECLRLIDEL